MHVAYDLWLRIRYAHGSMSLSGNGLHTLPRAGGYNDQIAILMDTFEVFSVIHLELTKEQRESGDD